MVTSRSTNISSVYEAFHFLLWKYELTNGKRSDCEEVVTPAFTICSCFCIYGKICSKNPSGLFAKRCIFCCWRPIHVSCIWSTVWKNFSACNTLSLFFSIQESISKTMSINLIFSHPSFVLQWHNHGFLLYNWLHHATHIPFTGWFIDRNPYFYHSGFKLHAFLEMNQTILTNWSHNAY